jgi:hypothetical protein
MIEGEPYGSLWERSYHSYARPTVTVYLDGALMAGTEPRWPGWAGRSPSVAVPPPSISGPGWGDRGSGAADAAGRRRAARQGSGIGLTVYTALATGCALPFLLTVPVGAREDRGNISERLFR